ncbi:MAG TPA: Ig-like domain-containing protein, partial [Thermoplasmata archaeon]|nr:Ig-like domain-containing protein [Thermoplasmata archaeon]
MIPALLSGANVYGVGHGGGYPLFDLGAMETSPFPSDLWTVRDRSQITDVRVALPKPDCTVRPSDCQDIDVLNTLDGFNLQPRIAVPFSEAIDPSSVTSDTVVLLAIDDDDTRNSGDDDRLGGNGDDNDVARIGINWIVWDPATMTLFVEPDQLLAQATRHALIVTTGVLDASGNPVGKSPEFAAFLRGESNDDEEDDDDDDDRGFGDRRSHRYREAIED